MWEEVKDSAHKLMARGEAFVQEKYESASRWWQDTKEKVTNAYNTVKYYAEHPQNFVEDMSSAIKEGLHEAAEKIEAGFHAVVEGAKGLCHAVANFVQEHPFIATAILIGVLAVATFFTGGAASAILLAATKGAIMGAASGFGFGVSLAARYKSAFGKSAVPKGYDVDHLIDLQFGGVDDILNMNPLDASVNRSLGAQIMNQIKNYDIGTVFGNFTIS